MLYSLNRWEQRDVLRDLLSVNDIVISSRYVPSGLAYGAAGGLSPKWLTNLDGGLPAPDVVLVIDVPVRTSTIRKPTKRDVHERNIKYLRKVRRRYLQFAKRKRWQIVAGTGSIQEVNERILSRIRERLALHRPAG
jgi:dTMP kinase